MSTDNPELQRAVEILSEEILSLKEQIRNSPSLRQGVVTTVPAGTPKSFSVAVDEGVYKDVFTWDASVANGDTVWILTLPGGTRIALGDLK